jgi:ribosomal protein L29
MKKNDFKKILNKSVAELTKEVSEGREKLWVATKNIASGKTKNVREARETRKDIARMLTLINAKKETK